LAFKGELSSPVSDRLLKAMEGTEAADLAKVEAVSVSAEVEAPWWNYEAKNNETPRQIAAIFGASLEDLVAQHQQHYPGFAASSKLKKVSNKLRVLPWRQLIGSRSVAFAGHPAAGSYRGPQRRTQCHRREQRGARRRSVRAARGGGRCAHNRGKSHDEHVRRARATAAPPA
jgi:hypothetical protein